MSSIDKYELSSIDSVEAEPSFTVLSYEDPDDPVECSSDEKSLRQPPWDSHDISATNSTHTISSTQRCFAIKRKVEKISQPADSPGNSPSCNQTQVALKYPQLKEPQNPGPLEKLLLSTIEKIRYDKVMLNYYKVNREIDKYNSKWVDFRIIETSSLHNGWLCTAAVIDRLNVPWQRIFHEPVRLILYSNKCFEKVKVDTRISCFLLIHNDQRSLFSTHNWVTRPNDGSTI